MLYSRAYKMMPAKRFTHPNNTSSIDFCMSLAPRFTRITTAIKTNKKEMAGNHFPELGKCSEILPATTADNFMAAASPTIKPNTEKSAMMNPLL